VTGAAGGPGYPTETVFGFGVPPVLFGLGAHAEVGRELVRRGVRRALVVTDERLLATGLPERIAATIEAAGVAATIWPGAITEPTLRAIEAAVEELAGVEVDGFVGVGGGSAIDTAKAVDLCITHGGPVESYLAAPFGEARTIPGPLRTLIGMPTTAGTGSEFTANCVIDLEHAHVKAAISNEAIRPALAIIDPAGTVTMSPAVTASSGFDVIVQALEAYTSRPYDRRPRYSGEGPRPTYSGAHPVADVCCERAIDLCGRFLRRAFHNGDDLEARVGMAQAALFSRIGAAGVHLPHAIGYAVSGGVRSYRPDGFDLTRPLVPHGQSVAIAAPACFAFTYPALPERHDRAAGLLGLAPGSGSAVPFPGMPGERNSGAGRELPGFLAELIAECGGPTCLADVGLGEDDVEDLAAAAHRQQRVLANSPLPVSEADLAGVLRASVLPYAG
jgi:hydroxyacid-oxoacid transhydrogenase